MTLERLKFYPEVARLNKWEGKVVVHMKVLEGGHLVDMEIQESSGFEVLDQTALTIVRQASPLDLGHPLPSTSVSLSVPLTFQLDWRIFVQPWGELNQRPFHRPRAVTDWHVQATN
jgi:periplasmic protein TonB